MTNSCPYHRRPVRDCPNCELFRRRQALGDCVAQARDWDHVVTLTFDEKHIRKPNPPGPQIRDTLNHQWRVSEYGETLENTQLSDNAALKRLERVLEVLEKRVGTVRGFFALEHQKRGAPHFHGLAQFECDPSRGADVMLSLWAGRAEVEQIDHLQKASTYAFKKVSAGEATFASWRVDSFKRRHHPKRCSRVPARLEVCP